MRHPTIVLALVSSFVASPARSDPGEQIRAAAGIGLGGAGPAVGAQASFEHRFGGQALGIAAGIDRSASITLGPSSDRTLGYLAGLWRVSAHGTRRAWDSQLGSQWSFTLLGGLGHATHRYETGDCGFKLWDDGIEDPFDPCTTHSNGDPGALVGGSLEWSYSFGYVGLGIDGSARALLGPVPTFNVIFGPVLSVNF